MPRLALQGLVGLYVSGGFDDALAAELLGHPGGVRPRLDRAAARRREDGVAARSRRGSRSWRRRDPSAGRAGAARSAPRSGCPGEQALPVIERLLLRDADADDPVIPWLLWWAVESKAMTDRERRDGVLRDAARTARARRCGRTSAGSSAATPRRARRPATRPPTSCSRRSTDAERAPLLEDLDRGLAERAVGLPAVGQGGLFDTLAAAGTRTAEAAAKFDPLTPELSEFIASAWRATPTERRRAPGSRCGPDIADGPRARSRRRRRPEDAAAARCSNGSPCSRNSATRRASPSCCRCSRRPTRRCRSAALAVLARVGGAGRRRRDREGVPGDAGGAASRGRARSCSAARSGRRRSSRSSTRGRFRPRTCRSSRCGCSRCSATRTSTRPSASTGAA